MPFLLGHPQLLFLDALQEVPAINIMINAKMMLEFMIFIKKLKLKIRVFN